MYITIRYSTAERDGTEIGHSWGDTCLCCIQLSSWQMPTDKGADIDTCHAKQIRPGREKWLHWLWKYAAVSVCYLLRLSKRFFPARVHVRVFCVLLFVFFCPLQSLDCKRIFWNLRFRDQHLGLLRGRSQGLVWAFKGCTAEVLYLLLTLQGI